MDIYLVGGAVRDELLGLVPHERDWVVVGATPQEMLAQGFIQVGSDFPVFLHPKTGEEYALARTERKNGRGYKGFTVYAALDVTLEADLARRDLTINAIAKDADGRLIDPFNGQRDLKKRILRHVSDAFIEDPLRVLRAARFAARFADFSIAAETMALMQKIVQQGEMQHLVPERIWIELDKTLAHDHAALFFEVLQTCKAFDPLFPPLAGQLPLFQQGLVNLNKAAGLDKPLKLALFLFPFFEKMHDKHAVDKFCENFRIPNHYKSVLAILVRAFPFYSTLKQEITAEHLLLLLEKIDAFRRPIQLVSFLKAALVLNDDATLLNTLIERSVSALKNADSSAFTASGLSGIEIAQAIRLKRLEIIRKSL